MSNLSKRQKEMTLLILSICFFAALGAYSYFQLFSPAKDKNEQLVQMIANERDVIYALQKQVANQVQGDTTSSQPLQRKVPVKPLEDALLLQIDKAEVKSETSITNVTFTLNEFVPENPPEEVGNIHTILAEVELEATNYSQVETFIREIEQMERLLNIDSIEFTAPEEIIEAEFEDQPLELTVSFYAFYRPDLIHLQDEAPKVDAPPSSNKKDPTAYNKMTGKEEVE